MLVNALLFLTAALSLLPIASSFRRQTRPQIATVRTMEMQLPSLKDISKSIAVASLSIALVDSAMSFGNYASQSIPTFIQPAHADVRAQQKRTYFRFAPKFNEGKEYYSSAMKLAVEKEDWTVVSKFFEDFVTKVNKEDSSNVQTDTYVNKYLVRPMIVLSGSFAERGQSPKTTALLEQQLAFSDAMKRLEGCTKDMKGEGFFASTIKMPTGKERALQAKKAFNDGMLAINQYVDIFNDGLMLELNALTRI